MTTTNTSPIKKASQPRLLEIDAAKGFAIMLVVFGHIVMRDQPLGNEWYTQVRRIIYAFHMPFFMYLGGFVMFYTKAAYITKTKFANYIQKRAYRLLVPFFLMGLLIFFGKTGASLFLTVDNVPLKSLEGLTALIWNTQSSPAVSLWYILVAFVYGAIVPPVLWLFKGNTLPLLIFSAILYFIPLPGYMYLDKIGQYFVFFMIGGMAAIHFDKFSVFIDQWKWALISAFIISLSMTFFDVNWTLCMAIVGTLSIPAIHAFVRTPQVQMSEILLFLGKYSFVIYLFNTIMIGLAKGVMFKFMTWHGTNFLLFVPILFGAGLLAPIILKELIFKRIPVIDKLTT